MDEHYENIQELKFEKLINSETCPRASYMKTFNPVRKYQSEIHF